MPRTLTTGTQSFRRLRENSYFYVDKTHFIRDWWNGGDDVTLITRPRRFGKTLMLDTVRTFFSPEFADRADLFDGLAIWKDEKFRSLQGTVPVIFLSFADIAERTCQNTIAAVTDVIRSTFRSFSTRLPDMPLTAWEQNLLAQFSDGSDREISEPELKRSVCRLAECLTRLYGTRPIILLDEYDTPLHEAWVRGYYTDLIDCMRGFFNSTFKTNPFLERGILTGITRISKESIFSGMNSLQVAGITTDLYTDSFGFTEQEVFAAMDEYGLTDREGVRRWYDGFIIGSQKEIYNPWSIIGYLSKRKFDTYWANTSSNSLIGELIARGNPSIKEILEQLIQGSTVSAIIDEHINFLNIYTDDTEILSLFMAAGYLKPIHIPSLYNSTYELTITNYEVYCILEKQISGWFSSVYRSKNEFLDALIKGNLDDMNAYMNHIAETIFGFFDTAARNEHRRDQPENFYHGIVLGMIIDLRGRYDIRSNRQSGYGRYDVMLFPKNPEDPGIIIEFKTLRQKKEADLGETCASALRQINEKNYCTELITRGIAKDRISVYGFAFDGNVVLICGGAVQNLQMNASSE